jgi:hypothetical protein
MIRDLPSYVTSPPLTTISLITATVKTTQLNHHPINHSKLPSLLESKHPSAASNWFYISES